MSQRDDALRETDSVGESARRQAECLKTDAAFTTVQGDGDSQSQAAPCSWLSGAPQQLGRYKILKLLGEGGMGSVYLAEDPDLERRVAVKVPFLRSGDAQMVLDRFRREAKAIAALHHPNICPVFEVSEADGTPYMAMAYIEGAPLSQCLDSRSPQDVGAVVKLVRKLALALDEAHRKGVVHRDLKPANIMIDARREPVIMDFGLARREGRQDKQLTCTGQMMGTPAYMPPEQVLGATDAMGPGCDIYSLGVILYQLLTGRLPFEGSLMTILSRITQEQPAPPSALRAGLPPALDAICARAMAKRPRDRFATMEAFAQALEQFLNLDRAAQASPSDQANVSTAEFRVAPPTARAPVARSGARPSGVSGRSQNSGAQRVNRQNAAGQGGRSVDARRAASSSPIWERPQWRIAMWCTTGVGTVVLAILLFFLFQPDDSGARAHNADLGSAATASRERNSAAERTLSGPAVNAQLGEFRLSSGGANLTLAPLLSSAAERLGLHLWTDGRQPCAAAMAVEQEGNRFAIFTSLSSGPVVGRRGGREVLHFPQAGVQWRTLPAPAAVEAAQAEQISSLARGFEAFGVDQTELTLVEAPVFTYQTVQGPGALFVFQSPAGAQLLMLICVQRLDSGNRRWQVAFAPLSDAGPLEVRYLDAPLEQLTPAASARRVRRTPLTSG